MSIFILFLFALPSEEDRAKQTKNQPVKSEFYCLDLMA